MSQYLPIACDLVDYIEHFIVRKEKVCLKYKNESEINTRYTILKDRYTNSQKEEYLILQDGSELRLDKILQINDILFQGSC